MDNEERAILAGLVAVAWADGEFAATEREMLRGLLDAYGANASERAEFEGYAARKRGLEDIAPNALSAGDRRLLLHHAVLLSFADGKQSVEESTFLHALAERLKIPSTEATAVVAAASERARASAKLL
jgi:uncharacterized tellurite resistance protein B-like protein